MSGLILQVLITVAGSAGLAGVVAAFLNRKKTHSESIKNTADAQSVVIANVQGENARLSNSNDRLRERIEAMEERFETLERNYKTLTHQYTLTRTDLRLLETWAGGVYSIMTEEQREAAGNLPKSSFAEYYGEETPLDETVTQRMK